MNLIEKHSNTILLSKIDIVNTLYNACKKAEYGETICDCLLDKMYLKTKLIRRLECFCFTDIENCNNCITVADLPKMYEVLNAI